MNWCKIYSLVCRASSTTDFCVCTSNDLWCRDTKSWWSSYTAFHTKGFYGVPHFKTRLIAFHKQVQAHCLQPELLAFTCSPPPPLLRIVGDLMCHPSKIHQFLSRRSAASPHFPPPSCIGAPCSFTKASSSTYASIPTVLLKPLPFDFHPPHLFSGVFFAPGGDVRKTRVCLLMAAFPDAGS